MKLNSTFSVTVLAIAAGIMNMPWAQQGPMVVDKSGTACTVGSPTRASMETTGYDTSVLKPWMTPAAYFVGNCNDCVLVDTIPQGYCESRGMDCDGWLGWNESYFWYRDIKIYECGTPGTPGYGFFVDCTYWDQDGCCNNGTTGLPPTNCAYQGAGNCADRPSGIGIP